MYIYNNISLNSS